MLFCISLINLLSDYSCAFCLLGSLNNMPISNLSILMLNGECFMQLRLIKYQHLDRVLEVTWMMNHVHEFVSK